MLENVGLEHSSKSTKYELEGSYGDPVHEHFSFLKTAKLPRECNEDWVALWDMPQDYIFKHLARLQEPSKTDLKPIL